MFEKYYFFMQANLAVMAVRVTVLGRRLWIKYGKNGYGEYAKIMFFVGDQVAVENDAGILYLTTTENIEALF